MFWMGAYTLRGEVGGGWALEFASFLGPVKWERADRRVPFGAKKTREFQGRSGALKQCFALHFGLLSFHITFYMPLVSARTIPSCKELLPISTLEV
jgi:hypothetical protein